MSAKTENTPDQLTPEEIQALSEANAKLVEDQAKQIADLRAQLEAKAAESKEVQAAALVAVVGKKKYQVLHGVQALVDGVMKVFSAQEVATNEPLCVRLIEQKSTALKAL